MGGRNAGKAEGLLNSITKNESPLHTIQPDHFGMLATIRKQNKHLLVAVDAFTKYTWIFAMKSTGTAEVIKNIKILQ